jgi:CRP-like cAMP-binding protein
MPLTDKDLGTVFPDGEIIFRQGEAADCLFFIQSGKVLIYQEKDGKEVPLAELGKGDSFGDMGAFMGPIRTESARSLGGARVITADYKFVLKKFRDDPSFAFQIINTMARRDRERTEEQEKTLEGLHLQHEELTARNRELNDAGQSAEESRDKNADYYDFAPVGAIDLDEEGIIRGINLSGAVLLGAERRDLLGLPFATFVPREDMDLYRKHLLECRGSSEGVITELLLNTRKGIPTKVQFFSYPKQDPDRIVYRTLMTELASRQQPDG